MPGRRNRRRRRNLQDSINYTDEGELSIQPEINKKKTGLTWRAERPWTFKFIDDGLILAKICTDTVAPEPGNGKLLRNKHDVQTQNLFRRVVAKAQSRGMVVNKNKTKILCITDVQTYTAAAHFFDRLESGGSMKVLGFHLNSRPSVHAHVQALKARMREKYWVL